MTDINHVVLIGRLTRDIGNNDLAYTSSGTARLNIGIAVNESRKQNGQWEDFASFFDVTVWGKTAENIKQYLAKGKQVAVDGHLRQDRWEKNGQRFSRVVIVADNVQLLGGKDAGKAQSPAQGYSDAGSEDDFPEDMPF